MKLFTFEFIPDITDIKNFTSSSDTYTGAVSELLANIAEFNEAPVELYLKLMQFAQSYIDMASELEYKEIFETEPGTNAQLTLTITNE